MMWAGICWGGCTDVIIIEGDSRIGQSYQGEALQPVVHLLSGAIGEDIAFMHDNAHAHASHVTMG